LLPVRHQARIAVHGEETVIADYVAGMTDRYAVQSYAALTAGTRPV
jgi:dGTP triphosphohydrolase